MEKAVEKIPEPNPTKIEDLPREVLIPIFNHLPVSSLDQLSLVLPEWKEIIDTEIGYEVTLTDVDVENKDDQPGSLRLMSSAAVQICHVKLPTDILCLPVLKYPSKLQILDFKAPISALVFETLLSNVVNLTQLHFGYSSLSGDDLSSIQLHLPNLKWLQIIDRSMESADISHEQELITENILALLNAKYPSIIELDLSTIATQASTKKFVFALLKFLERHWETVKIVKFGVTCTILRVHMLLHHDHDMPDDNLSVDFTKEEVNELDSDKLSKVQLRTLELDFGKNYMVGLSQWDDFIKAQVSLKSVIIFKNAPVSLEICKQLIFNNCQQLSYIQIGVQIKSNYSSIIEDVIDCTVFEVCTGLRKLGLVGNCSVINETTTKQLINCGKLPRRILALSLKNICVESGEILIIVQKLSHIVKLTLDNIGTKGDCGVTIGMLDKILKGQKCYEMIVKGMNATDGDGFPKILAELEIDSPLALPFCHFHTKYCHDLKQYICICT